MADIVSKKIFKKKGQKPDALELEVAKALLDLEISSKDLTADLRQLYISAARQIDMPGGKKAIVIFVPFRLHRRFKHIQGRLVRDLEKKFNNKHVVIIAQRTIMSKNYARQSHGQLRPRSRTLTSVHENILNDIVYPTRIVGKRTRVRDGNNKTLKVYLDPADMKDVDYKLKTFSAVYKALTNKQTEFIFPIQE
jgi:small subunit ribosomal protein S7e